MEHAPTVQFGDVLVLRETALALVCRIAGQSRSLALSRLQPGSAVRHAGDRGVLVLTRNFAVELGLERGPRARCNGLKKKDGLPCGAIPRSGSRFCWSHATAGEPTVLHTPPPANRCESLRLNGRLCRAPQRPGIAVCYSHDPATAKQRGLAQALALAAARKASVRRRVG